MAPTLSLTPAPHPQAATLALALAAAAAPPLLAWNTAPSSTFLNQALALGLWGAFVCAAALAAPGASMRWYRHRPTAAPLAALALLALSVLWSWGPGSLPSGLALQALGLIAAAALLLQAGAAARGAGPALTAAFFAGWVLAGLLCAAIGALQVFAPQWVDGDWIARSTLPGRAVGNLRQPNHLSSLLLWAAIAVVALVELRRIGPRTAAALFTLMIFAVVLTASRTGVVGVALLALWGLADRRLLRPTRRLLFAAPLLYALAWWTLAAWADDGAHRFGGTERLAEADLSASRFGIWANTLALIRAQPWAGVGFGEFNFAWTLTPFPGRPTAFFDHAHNLPLHLAAELGLPLAAAVMALLLWALAQAVRRSAADAGARAALMMVLMIGLHSLLEYPLWYSYFLLPTAWAWGLALASSPSTPRVTTAARPSTARVLGGSMLMLAAAVSVLDYMRVAAIFSAPQDAAPLAERVARGQRSLLFAHHADYAAVTALGPRRADDAAFAGATHYLLDGRLLQAWARALAASGRDDEARHVTARLREFSARSDAGADFFADCAKPASAAAFQCNEPQRAWGWRELSPR